MAEKKCYLEIFGNLLMEKISVFDGKNHHKKTISKFDFHSKIHKIKGIIRFDCNYPINICTVWFPLKSEHRGLKIHEKWIVSVYLDHLSCLHHFTS